MSKSIAVIGTLDNKGEEIKYVADLIEKRGHRALVIDVGVVGEPYFQPTISKGQVAQAAGSSLEEVIALGAGSHGDAAPAMAKMAEGACKIIEKLYSGNKLDGILALGGTAGTSLALSGDKRVAYGIPKLILSTVAFSPAIPGMPSVADLMMMRWVAGLRGINSINRKCLRPRREQLSVPLRQLARQKLPRRRSLGVSAMGVSTATYSPKWLEPALKQRGYEVVMFHALSGGRETRTTYRRG